MNAQAKRYRPNIALLPLLLLLTATHGFAQAPADPYEKSPTSGDEGIPVLTQAELVELVGPIALYPDDLLAIVLPASTYPLQLVQASRFLDDLEQDSSLEPDESWDDSVVALTNYPEVIELLNEDLDWTWQLGEAVVAQQADIIKAIESFRDRAYTAGNLRSDEHQNVTNSDGVIEIAPVEEDVIYVPYYEPERVVVYQPQPVYYYYPRPYPVYYYPYPYGYNFHYSYFWGVTTAFTIGWLTDSVHVYHHSYYGHPYYGHHYYNHGWYRSPTIHVHNSTYVYNSYRPSRHVDHGGDYWHPPGHRRRLGRSDHRITNSRYYTNRGNPNHGNRNHGNPNHGNPNHGNPNHGNGRNDSDHPGNRGHDGTTNGESHGNTRQRNRPQNRRNGQGSDAQEQNDTISTYTRRRSTQDSSRQNDRERPRIRHDNDRTGRTDITAAERRNNRPAVTTARRGDTTRRSGSYTPPQRQSHANATTVRRPSHSGAAPQPVRRTPQPSYQARNSHANTAPRSQPQPSDQARNSHANTAPRSQPQPSYQARNSHTNTAPRSQPQQSQASTAHSSQRRASAQGTARSESRRQNGRNRRD